MQYKMLKFIEAYIEHNLAVSYTIPNESDVEIIYNFYLKKLSSPKYKDIGHIDVDFMTTDENAKRQRLDKSEEENLVVSTTCLFFYGLFYEIHENYDKMLYYFQLATKNNHIPAIIRLADFYYLKKDMTGYVYYLTQGVGLENTYCLYNLAEYYHVYENNIKQFKKLHKKAVILHYKKSAKSLAYYYDTIKNDEKKVEYYYLQAIELGSLSSLRRLADHYSHNKKYTDMKKYYLRAIEQGDILAAENLGRYYLEIEDNTELGVNYCMQAVDITEPDGIHQLYKKFKHNKRHLAEFHRALAFIIKNK